MNTAGNGNGVSEYRRRLISKLLIRKPNITQRELQEALGSQVRNPRTNQPYSLATMNRDIQRIREEWQEKTARDYSVWVADEMAKLEELEAEAWHQGRLEIVLRCMDRRAKLVGLDKPARVELNWRERAKADGVNPEELVDALAQEFARAMTADADDSG